MTTPEDIDQLLEAARSIQSLSSRLPGKPAKSEWAARVERSLHKVGGFFAQCARKVKRN